ncbi:hypothetical protein [Aquimarina algicola]|uniref:Uncharacterized protein n=1 Tax=Aquimarina algicola TaxID=2589995 RepID=A0A504JKU0_9FLAO|nr:hypothetical protein [Aquimarina algicola]TPN87090.1 hypothetical protein FHK87_05730 [Aquimarina algicola]
MLNRVIKRIKSHNDLVSNHKEGKISDSDFEKYLLDEIDFVQQDLDEKLNDELLKEEEKLRKNITKMQYVIAKTNLDEITLKNLIYSEFNHLFLKQHIL